MKIRYVGPHQTVEIAATGQICPKGETVDVKADLARSLVKQASWEKVKPKPEAKEAS